jgi:hypothetical protein
MIWLDRGSKLVDGASEEVIRAYEHSIRLQEESRLRTKAAVAKSNGANICVMELSVAQQQPLRGEFLVSHVRMIDRQGAIIADLPLSSATPSGIFEPAFGFLTHEARSGQSVLGNSAAVKRTRLTFEIDNKNLDPILRGEATLEMDYWANQENVICIDLWRKEQCIARTYLHTTADDQGRGWYNAQQRFEKPSSHLAEQSSILGTGRVWIENVEICDELGNARFVFESQDPMQVRCHYRTHANHGAPVSVEFLLAFHRDGVTDVLRMIAPPVSLPENSEGVIEFIWKDCALARGRFTFTLMVVKPDYFDSNDGKFYSINDDVYFVFNRGVEISVDGGSNKFGGTNVVAPMKISITPNR